MSIGGAALGIFTAWRFYRDLRIPLEFRQKWNWLYRAVLNKWYVDEGYAFIFIRPIHQLSVALWKGFDVAVIDRIVLGFGQVSLWTGEVLRLAQTGSLQVYAFVFLLGLAAMLGYLIYGFIF